MTVQERRAWIKFMGEALAIPGMSEKDAAVKADAALEELVARCPEIRTAPRSPNRKPRFRRKAPSGAQLEAAVDAVLTAVECATDEELEEARKDS